MRDLALIGFLLAFIGLGFKRPFLLVLAFLYVDIVQPQRLSYHLLNSVPVSLIVALLAMGAWAVADEKRWSRFTGRQVLIVMLLAYVGLTTINADLPIEAQTKWEWVWKVLLFSAFLPLTLWSRTRIEALLLTFALCAASIIIPVGMKTAAGGGGYGQGLSLADNNTGLFEGSIMSTAAIALIPILLWFTRHGTIFKPDWRVKTFCFALIFACLLIPVGTQARTGIICIAALALLMLRNVKRRFLYIGMIAALGAVAVPFLPQSFSERMGTIQTYQADQSASTRLAIWAWTIDYANENPFGGGFEAYRQNRLRFETQKAADAGPTASVNAQVIEDKGRAYHSSYFEMLGEQGYPGLIMWLLLHAIGLVRMEVVRRRYRKVKEGEDAWIAPLAGALQTAHLVYLTGSVFVGIAFQPFAFTFIAAEIGIDAHLRRRKALAAEEKRSREKRVATPSATLAGAPSLRGA
jgi:probable O-glycosylation ligase (exosortase A-associated)